MRQNELRRVATLLLRRTGPKQRPYVIGLLAVGAVAYFLLAPALEKRFGWSLPTATTTDHSSSAPSRLPDPVDLRGGEQAILDAFRQRRSNVIVTGRATVKKLLPDDNVGDRHQKMILRLPSGHSLLLAHNIDLADRIPVDEGDKIEFSGEYEYSEQGGVLHWTHHDPRGRHPGGWIRLNGTQYE